jgi:hypothetical protein
MPTKLWGPTKPFQFGGRRLYHWPCGESLICPLCGAEDNRWLALPKYADMRWGSVRYIKATTLWSRVWPRLKKALPDCGFCGALGSFPHLVGPTQLDDKNMIR